MRAIAIDAARRSSPEVRPEENDVLAEADASREAELLGKECLVSGEGEVDVVMAGTAGTQAEER